MDWKLISVTFVTVFLAELGDKTQLATFLLTSKTGAPWSVFLGSALALVLASLLGVLAGEMISKVLSPTYLQFAAACGFLIIGAVMLWQLSRGA